MTPTMQTIIPRYTYALAILSVPILILGIGLQIAAHRIAAIGVRTERVE